jgi:hypothetical protein
MASKSGYIASLASHTQSCLTMGMVRVRVRLRVRVRVRVRVRARVWLSDGCVGPFAEFGPSNAPIANVRELRRQEITKCKTIACTRHEIDGTKGKVKAAIDGSKGKYLWRIA